MRSWQRIAMVAVATACGWALGAPPPASATNTSGALVSSAACTQNEIERNDDLYSDAASLPFSVDFYGRRYDSLWVNNNGNVTFDEPLSTYTPFGLKNTSRAIIAPFFADVDTRGDASEKVKFGWGQTVFEGRRAFCANWVDVGYYNAHTDKLNSFQLLLVDRADVATGDFDIVFNYGTINWETGDASGGIGGLGGDSARVGFSNGDGTDANSFELPFSGRDGALLDSSSVGLIHEAITVPPLARQRGRYVFQIRNGQPAPSEYVALGDSYSSGLGAGGYGSTDGACYRSDKAYSVLLKERNVAPFELEFAACAGAKVDDLYTTFKGESTQLDRLGANTALATVGIGGNDLGFAELIKRCLGDEVDYVFIRTSSCADDYDDDVFERMQILQGRVGGGPVNKLQRLYADIRTRAPRAKLVAPGYPRFFPIDGGAGTFSTVLGWLISTGGQRCNGFRISDQIWINDKISDLNLAIASSVRSMGGHYADTFYRFEGHELCGEEESWLNGIKLPVISTLDESFHPKAEGQVAYANAIQGELETGPGSEPFIVAQGETLTTTRTLGDLLGATFDIHWPGSTVEMTLVSPSGRVISADTVADDVQHLSSPTSQLIYVHEPEPGEWQVKLYGADVEPEGERTWLELHQQPVPGKPPVASMTVERTGRATITADAGASSDPDGRVVDYLWDFGDGTYAFGERVHHVYEEPGTYRVNLVVQDDDLDLGYDHQDTDLTITPYAFSGFKAPVDNQPAVNTVQAGRAIPVKFSLGGPEGTDIFEAGYPKVRRVDCVSGAPTDEIEQTVTAGSSSLGYDAASDTYTYTWKTDKAWAGSCREFVLGLDDASDHTASFRLR